MTGDCQTVFSALLAALAMSTMILLSSSSGRKKCKPVGQEASAEQAGWHVGFFRMGGR